MAGYDRLYIYNRYIRFGARLHSRPYSALLRLHHPPRYHIRQLPTLATLPLFLIPRELIHSLLDLGAEIGTMKARLMHHGVACLTVPAQRIQAIHRTRLLQHNTNCVGEADGVVRRVGREEKHLALPDRNVAEGGRSGSLVYYFQQHRASVLVEPFGCGVDVVVSARVGTTDDHYCYIIIVDAIIIDWRFE